VGLGDKKRGGSGEKEKLRRVKSHSV